MSIPETIANKIVTWDGLQNYHEMIKNELPNLGENNAKGSIEEMRFIWGKDNSGLDNVNLLFVLGEGNANIGANQCTVIGGKNTILCKPYRAGNSFSDVQSLILGYSNNLSGATSATGMGDSYINPFQCYVYGSNNKVSGNIRNSLILGCTNQIFDVDNAAAENVLLIGDHHSLSNKNIPYPLTHMLLIGNNNEISNTKYDLTSSILIGSYLKTESSNQIVLGQYNATDDTASLIFGSGSAVKGRSNSFVITKSHSAWLGSNNAISTDVTNSWIAGSNNTALTETANSWIAGSNNVIGDTSNPQKSENVFLLGDNLKINSTNKSILITGTFNESTTLENMAFVIGGGIPGGGGHTAVPRNIFTVDYGGNVFFSGTIKNSISIQSTLMKSVKTIIDGYGFVKNELHAFDNKSQALWTVGSSSSILEINKENVSSDKYTTTLNYQIPSSIHFYAGKDDKGNQKLANLLCGDIDGNVAHFTTTRSPTVVTNTIRTTSSALDTVDFYITTSQNRSNIDCGAIITHCKKIAAAYKMAGTVGYYYKIGDFKTGVYIFDQDVLFLDLAKLKPNSQEDVTYTTSSYEIQTFYVPANSQKSADGTYIPAGRYLSFHKSHNGEGLSERLQLVLQISTAS